MGKLKIEYLPPETLMPYENNTRKHAPTDIDQIKESIEKDGFNDLIGVWGDNNIIVEGHGRQIAAMEMGITSVPVIRLDHLTDAQRRDYAIRHNRTAELSTWDFETLQEEIARLEIEGHDLSGLEFDFSGIEEQERLHQEYKEQEQYDDANILQLEKAQYAGVGEYDIPEILPEDLPEITEWIGFNYMLSEQEPEGKGVHCFVNDYQFERLWSNPDRYIEKLSKFAAVASPDFSPYGDMPFCLQLFNHYRKHWVGRYLQENGVHVVPTIRASTDARSKSFYLDGEPKNSPVIISSMYTNDEESRRIYQEEYNTMYDTLNPSCVFIYGKQFGWERGNIVHVETFTDKRFRG